MPQPLQTHIPNARGRAEGRRRGTVLIYLVVLLPIIFGVLAILLDRGAGAYSQRMMQTAADTAAVEGLLQSDTALTEEQRRQRVRQTIRQHFDDNLDPGDGDERNVSAGGYFTETTPGRTDLNASQTLNFANPQFYDPDPQLNLLNAEHGDMLAGHYLHGDRHDEGYNANPYDRDDFVPETGAMVPADATEAFMVRLRRTSNYATSAHQDNQPGVSSAGPPVPAIFSRGTMVEASPAGEPSIRRDGLTVRATSIAAAEKTTRLGPLIPPELTGAGTLYGWNLIALTVQEYASLSVGTGQRYDIQPDGTLFRPGGNIEVGRMIRVTTLENSDQPVVSGALSENDPTITVSSSAGFSAAAVSRPFLIRMEDEIMRVISTNGNDWTVQRGVNGTTAAAHDSDTLIYMHEAARLGDIMETAARIELPEVAESATGAELLVRIRGAENAPSATYNDFYTIAYISNTLGQDWPVARVEFDLGPGRQFDFGGTANDPIVNSAVSRDSNGVVLDNTNVIFQQMAGHPNQQNIYFAPGIHFGPGSVLQFGAGTRGDLIDSGDEWTTVPGDPIEVLAHIENGTLPRPRNVYQFAQTGTNESTGVLTNTSRSRNVVSTRLFDEEEGRLYVPVYDPNISNRLIGFGVADVSGDASADNDGDAQDEEGYGVMVVRQPSAVAPNNASATFGGDFNQQGLPMTPAEISAIFTARRNFDADPLCSPASVRAQSK